MTDSPISEGPIQYYSEDISFQLDDDVKVSTWLEESVVAEKGNLVALNFIFCSDDYLHRLNVQYLQHDTLTDVITFPYSEGQVEGDIFISIDRVRENARVFESGFTKELYRVMIHGVLHLLGYGDKSETEKQLIREKENFYLQLI